jgi:hypothetical protein
MTLSDGELLAFLKLKLLIDSGYPPMYEFLDWIHARLEKVHHEDPLMDYMHALKRYADGIREIARAIQH